MNARTCLSVVLAAGEGTRMRSRRPKVLHRLAGRTLLGHVLNAVRDAGGTAHAVVIGPNHEDVAAEARATLPNVGIYMQAGRPATPNAGRPTSWWSLPTRH